MIQFKEIEGNIQNVLRTFSEDYLAIKLVLYAIVCVCLCLPSYIFEQYSYSGCTIELLAKIFPILMKG